MNWIVSALFLVVMFYLEPTLPSHGNAAISAVFGFGVTILVYLPPYVVAEIISTKLKCSKWTQLVMVAGMWFTVWLGFFLYDPKISGLSSMRDVLKATGQFWTGSLAYGIPWVILGYLRPLLKTAPATSGRE